MNSHVGAACSDAGLPRSREVSTPPSSTRASTMHCKPAHIANSARHRRAVPATIDARRSASDRPGRPEHGDRDRLAVLAIAAHARLLPTCPRLTFASVAARWLERFETMVAVGERRVRSLEGHGFRLDRHLLPALG